MQHLSQRLKRSLPDGFFRFLAWSSAPVYVDCLEQLVEAAEESGRLRQAEARAIIHEVSSNHLDIGWSDNEGGKQADIRIKTSRILNNLLDAKWLEDRPESIQDRWVIISPASRPLLRMLRELASDEIAELKSFADTLESICRTLESAYILDPNKQTSSSLRSTVSELLQRLDQAISQLHSVEKVIHGFEQRQLQSQSGAETLQITYGDFNEGQHMVCYDVLHRRGLLPRISRARNLVQDACENPFTFEKLTTGFQIDLQLSEEEAWTRAEAELRSLLRGLGGIRQRAEAVDGRIASFHRLSKQRYLYQSQMRGRRPELARSICDAINHRWAGKRFIDIEEEPWFNLLAPEVEIFYGTYSLFSPKRARVQPSLRLGVSAISPPSEEELERLRQSQRVALTPERAARIVATLLPKKGDKKTTSEIEIDSEEAFLNLLAAASFNQFNSLTGTCRWSVDLARSENRLDPEAITRDSLADWEVESFTLTRTQ